ncbi:MAG: hypothetical protein LM514_05430 [Streptococcus sp.]|jgi:hypothetical protein|nr:hypothetical protein [Streptococcus sp.]
MKLQAIIRMLFLFTGCTAIISCSAVAGDGDEQIYNTPKPIVVVPERQQPTNSKKNGFEQHFYGPTTIIRPDGKGEPFVGKPNPATTVQKSLPVNAASDLMLIEEFVKRGLVQRIKDGSLSLTGSSAFWELKSSLVAKQPACSKSPNKKENQKKH